MCCSSTFLNNDKPAPIFRSINRKMTAITSCSFGVFFRRKTPCCCLLRYFSLMSPPHTFLIAVCFEPLGVLAPNQQTALSRVHKHTHLEEKRWPKTPFALRPLFFPLENARLPPPSPSGRGGTSPWDPRAVTARAAGRKHPGRPLPKRRAAAARRPWGCARSLARIGAAV